MKFLRAAVITLLLASSSASAASFYFGVRLDVPIAFEQVGQTTNTIVAPMIGVQAGLDFDSSSNGFGLRFAVSSQLVTGFRGAVDGYVRFPIQPEFSSYVGAGATVWAGPVLLANVHALAGLEYQVSPGIGLFAELSPGYALGYGRNGCYGAPPIDVGTCGALIPFTLESAIGLNFRF